jgi:pteridine reductase
MIDIHADRPLSDHSVYCISKAGLQMCTLSLAKEFAPYVRVNAVSGGAILLPETYDDQLKHALISKIPLKEIGDPGDIISALEYLVSSAKYVTGQIIRVDGGRTLNQ